MLKQPLLEKQISDGKRLIVASRRNVQGSACESGKYFAWKAFAVSIEFGAERWRSALCDYTRDPSRMIIRRRRLGLGSTHRATSTNRERIARNRALAFQNRRYPLPKAGRAAQVPIRRSDRYQAPRALIGGPIRRLVVIRRRYRTKSYIGAAAD